ncbi:hypothetical protein PITC_085030 [Penicillium italicum]|uniref:Metallo-beta-lactamase domain-containing protein n=1 Tax=Penicillium italicum TaxID=40296 RepID=A0A0A2L525_PENIT|nr:hypothetical protein PITC_085030 [Penicillium italicum]
MKGISIDPSRNYPPSRDLPLLTLTPTQLPPAKVTKLHPSKSGEENAALFFPNFLHAGDHVHLGPGLSSERLTDPAIDLHDLPRVDLVLLSHYHEDHFDKKVEASLRRDLPIITTQHAKDRLTSKKQDPFTSVSALDPFEQIEVCIGGTEGPGQPRLRVTGMPGKHVPPNRVVDKLNTLANVFPPTNGWMLELGHGSTHTADFSCGYRIYISGDTLMFDELREIPKRYAGQQIDLMLVHLGGTTIPSPLVGRLMEPLAMTVTMDAEQGLQLIQQIQPDITIPIHYDDYDEFASPLEDFRRIIEVAGAEELARPAFALPDPNLSNADSDRRFSQFECSAPGPVQNQPQYLNRTQSQRRKTFRDRPTVNVVASDDSHHTKSRVERRVSVKGKTISLPISQPTSPGDLYPETLKESDELPPHPRHSYAENPSPGTPQSLAYQQQYQQAHRAPRPSHPAHAQDKAEWSQQPVQPLYTQLQRSSTDPTLLEQPADLIPESPRYAPEHLHRQEPVLSTRPPSQQTHEPLSPLPPVYPDAMQSSAQASQNQGQFQQLDRQKSAGSPQQNRSRQGSVSNNMPDPGRSTPTNTHRREDSGEVDERALIQKHDELQAKFAKLKRYYLEKNAQVQHLQNTVAHQRMAVSRTVLDDNEYTNRFQRLDGAIKDLAFSVRKHWRSIPSWLNGMVTDDALSVGTKEMTAVGRAVISRWLVEEIFQRYFHPSLESKFSEQLKNIEMNLRQQRPSSDEDRENVSARLSYWRRTTFDGLSDSLVGPDAQKHRLGLVDNLIGKLATYMGSQLHETASPGLEASVRMIIENSVNIIDKLPLEARDVCVDYFLPGVSLAEQYMKVEGQLPALSHPPRPPSSAEHLEEPVAAEGDASSGSTAGIIENASPAQQKPSKKSIFGALISRKHISSEISRPAPAPGPAEDKSEPAELALSGPRIRFAAFLAVEVRGKGPATVLIKSPVWLVE